MIGHWDPTRPLLWMRTLVSPSKSHYPVMRRQDRQAVSVNGRASTNVSLTALMDIFHLGFSRGGGGAWSMGLSEPRPSRLCRTSLSTITWYALSFDSSSSRPCISSNILLYMFTV